jgi:hypothetical protein
MGETSASFCASEKARQRSLAERFAKDVFLPKNGGMPEAMRRAFGGKMQRNVLREYVPTSWFHPVGIKKVLRRLEPRLPDVAGKLFLTFTLERETCGGDPEAAFERGRAKLRKVFYALRNGVECDGRRYEIDAPYCVKVEFHQDGWAHFHVIFLTSRFLPGQLLNELWSLGRCNVQRIKNKDFRYLLKYVCKGCELPDWIKNRRRLRVFQSSHGFLKEPEKSEKPVSDNPAATEPIRRHRDSGNIGERLLRWEHLGVIESECGGLERKNYHCVPLRANFRDILIDKALMLALQNRYLGDGRVLIAKPEELLEWTA